MEDKKSKPVSKFVRYELTSDSLSMNFSEVRSTEKGEFKKVIGYYSSFEALHKGVLTHETKNLLQDNEICQITKAKIVEISETIIELCEEFKNNKLCTSKD